MKLEDINQTTNTLPHINQADKPNLPDKKQNAVEAGKQTSATDKVELSAQSKDLKKIRDVLAMTPDVRTERVAALKKAIEDGQYKIQAEAVADKMLKEQMID